MSDLHEELRKTYRPGQKWEYLSHLAGRWIAVVNCNGPAEPAWLPEYKYRLREDAPAPAQQVRMLTEAESVDALERVGALHLTYRSGDSVQVTQIGMRAVREIQTAFIAKNAGLVIPPSGKLEE